MPDTKLLCSTALIKTCRHRLCCSNRPLYQPCTLQVMVGTAYFGHALLAELLLPKLKASAPARIVWMSGALEAQANVRWDDLGCAWEAATAGACVLCDLWVINVYGLWPLHNRRKPGWQVQAWCSV